MRSLYSQTAGPFRLARHARGTVLRNVTLGMIDTKAARANGLFKNKTKQKTVETCLQLSAMPSFAGACRAVAAYYLH